MSILFRNGEDPNSLSVSSSNSKQTQTLTFEFSRFVHCTEPQSNSVHSKQLRRTRALVSSSLILRRFFLLHFQVIKYSCFFFFFVSISCLFTFLVAATHAVRPFSIACERDIHLFIFEVAFRILVSLLTKHFN